MHLESEALANNITRIALSGRLDIVGAREIDLQFQGLTTNRKAAIIVDLSGVDFIASIGIRTLLASARSQSNRGGKLVLLNPQPAVKGVLQTAGVSDLIPVFDDQTAAEAALQGIA